MSERSLRKTVIVAGGFDDIRSRQVRFLEEASWFGSLHVLLWPDETIERLCGQAPRFPLEERQYILESIRFVDRVILAPSSVERASLPVLDGVQPDLWVMEEAEDSAARRLFCAAAGLECRVLTTCDLEGFPGPSAADQSPTPGRKKAIVTGCYDWLHSGHVRFFEEVAELGDLYVGVGNDANVRLLKGEHHPQFPQEERRYLVQSIRTVKQAVISTGMGWLDAEPEIASIHPDLYVVNEDGDKPEKREFCRVHGIEYVVLRRLPKEGLPRRQSTALRGF